MSKEGYRPQQIVQQEVKPQGDPASQEHSTPPQKSALNRAVERTRNLYERNGWTFLPLSVPGELSSGVPKLQGEQQPHGGGINKPELHPPKELPLPFEPNLPRHEQQLDNIDPEMERVLRYYAEAVAEGDPEYEKSLHERYKNDPSFRESFDRFRRGGRRGAGTLTYSTPDFSKLPKNQE